MYGFRNVCREAQWKQGKTVQQREPFHPTVGMAMSCVSPNAYSRRPFCLLLLVFVPKPRTHDTNCRTVSLRRDATQDFDGAWWNFIPKVIADQTVWSVFLNAAYSTMIMGLQGKSQDEVSR